MTTRARDLTTPALYSQTRPSRGTVQASQSAALAELANDAAGGHPAQRATVLAAPGALGNKKFSCFIWPDTTAIYYAVRASVGWTTAISNAGTLVELSVTDGTTTVGPGASPYLPRDLLYPLRPFVSGARLDDFDMREVFVQRDSLVAAGLSPSVPWRFIFDVNVDGGTRLEAIEIAEVSRFATDTADTYGADPDYYQPRSIIDDNVVAIGATLEAAYDRQRRTYQAVSLDEAAPDNVTSNAYAPIPGSQLESAGVASRWEVRPRLMGGVPELQFGVRYRTTGSHTGGVRITTGAGTYALTLPTTGGVFADLFTGVGYLAQTSTDEIYWEAFSSAGTLKITSYWIVETP